MQMLVNNQGLPEKDSEVTLTITMTQNQDGKDDESQMAQNKFAGTLIDESFAVAQKSINNQEQTQTNFRSNIVNQIEGLQDGGIDKQIVSAR